MREPLRGLPSYSALAFVALVPFAMTAYACGSKEPPVAPPVPSATDTGSSATSASAGPSGPDTSAPPASSAAEIPAPPASTGSKKAQAKNDASWAPCHQSYKGTSKDKNLPADVAGMAKACATATKMHLVGKTITGEQADEGTPQTYPLKAEAGHCYRVYGYAASTIKDLDVSIKDSNGDIAGTDSTDDPTPVVLEDGAVCFKDADSASVVVSVGMGKGKYALQIWSD
jgi:hypothetical protein